MVTSKVVDTTKPHKIAWVKNLFLKGVLGIYVIAFASLYVQVKALFGDEGVVPIADYIKRADAPKTLEKYNIIVLASKFTGLNHGTALELVCLVSIFVAAAGVLSRRFANTSSFAFLWYIYFCIQQVGQGFMSFHSDLMLLEVGFLAIFLAPLIPQANYSSSDHDHLFWFLTQWLVFRYFVTNVIHAYSNDDQTFYNKSSVQAIAVGVPFPSIAAWNLFNLSQEHQVAVQVFLNTLKLTAPFLFVLDFTYTRFLAFYTLLFISIAQALFFNFGYTDLLIAVSLISVLKDSYLNRGSKSKRSTLSLMFDVLFVLAYAVLVSHIQTTYFGMAFNSAGIVTKFKFTHAQFKVFVNYLIPATLAVGVYKFIGAMYKTYFLGSRKTSLLKNVLYTCFALALFLASVPTLTRFQPQLEQKLKPLHIKNLSQHVALLKVANNYNVLSEVAQHYSNGRPELIIQSKESSTDENWDQFDLLYKPGQQTKPLRFVVPHLPRLDTKMWYAARSNLANNQWLQTLVYRLATQQSDVLKAVAKDNFIAKSGVVRVARYNYKFSSKSKTPFAGHWSQVKFVDEYLPTTSVENLKQAVKSNGLSLAPAKPAASKPESFEKLINKYLDISSDYIRGIDQTAVVWTLLSIVVVSMLRR